MFQAPIDANSSQGVEQLLSMYYLQSKFALTVKRKISTRSFPAVGNDKLRELGSKSKSRKGFISTWFERPKGNVATDKSFRRDLYK